MRSETRSCISAACLWTIATRRAASPPTDSSSASVSDAARTVAIGVRSSCETSATNCRRIPSVRSRSVTSDATPTAAGSPAAGDPGTARTTISRSLSPRSRPSTFTRTGPPSPLSPLTSDEKSRRTPGSRTRSWSAAQGADGGTPKSVAGRRVDVEDRERPVDDDESDRHLLEDRPREEARPLASGPLRARRGRRSGSGARKTSSVSAESELPSSGRVPRPAFATPSRTRSSSRIRRRRIDEEGRRHERSGHERPRLEACDGDRDRPESERLDGRPRPGNGRRGHAGNLYPTPTTVSTTSSPTFLRIDRTWTSTVRVSTSAA